MNRIYIKFLVMLLVFISCNQEENIVSEPISKEPTTLKKQNGRTRSFSDFQTNNIDLLENKMQWFGYLVLRATNNNIRARQEFLVILENSRKRNVLKLETLLGENVNNERFIEALKETYLHYQYLTESDGTIRPMERPRPGGGPGEDPGSDSDVRSSSDFQMYISYLLDDCLELYFPNGYTDLDGDLYDFTSMISSAHPLNNTNYNDEAYLFSDSGSILGSSPISISETSVGEATRGLMMIVRPVRSQDARGCQYSEYSSINDFTDFLAN
ncbi:hypothetical protein [Tenacibaculum amylolyticum]|uniref:hypothetical protein n=1 Tax=Tenacibaculum amylolyticum TaxID=104269 RepID=UPI0038956F2E